MKDGSRHSDCAEEKTMNNAVRFCEPPVGSTAAYLAIDADSIDCRQVLVANAECSALTYTLQLLKSMPAWVEELRALRIRLSEMSGIRNFAYRDGIDPGKADTDYQIGEHIGNYSLASHTVDEVLLSDWGRHFDVYLALNCLPVDASGQRLLVLAILVRSHGYLGRLCSLLLRPFHKYLVSRMLAAVSSV